MPSHVCMTRQKPYRSVLNSETIISVNVTVDEEEPDDRTAAPAISALPRIVCSFHPGGTTIRKAGPAAPKTISNVLNRMDSFERRSSAAPVAYVDVLPPGGMSWSGRSSRSTMLCAIDYSLAQLFVCCRVLRSNNGASSYR